MLVMIAALNGDWKLNFYDAVSSGREDEPMKGMAGKEIRKQNTITWISKVSFYEDLAGAGVGIQIKGRD